MVPDRRLSAAVGSHDVVRGPRQATGRAVSNAARRCGRVVVKDGRVAGVETDGGTIECEMVINAAGAHAYHIAQSVGLELPIVPVRHEYFVTVHADGLRPDFAGGSHSRFDALPAGGNQFAAVRRLGTQAACRPTRGNSRSTASRRRSIPDWDVLGWFAEQLAPEIPQVEELGVRSVFRGWPTFTPDGRFIIGESSRVKGFVMAGGCNAHGVSGSAGIGRHVVESILEPDPSPYVKSLSPDRFQRALGLANRAAAGAALLRNVLRPGALIHIAGQILARRELANSFDFARFLKPASRWAGYVSPRTLHRLVNHLAGLLVSQNQLRAAVRHALFFEKHVIGVVIAEDGEALRPIRGRARSGKFTGCHCFFSIEAYAASMIALTT